MAMQILAEKGKGKKLMSEALIKNGCHEVLFQMLERHEGDQGIKLFLSNCYASCLIGFISCPVLSLLLFGICCWCPVKVSNIFVSFDN